MNLIAAIQPLSELPLFQQWNLGIIWGIYSLCLILTLLGASVQAIMRRAKDGSPAASQPSFPRGWDIALVYLFLAFMALLMSFSAANTQDQVKSFSVMALISQAILYFPVVIRMAAVPTAPDRAGWGKSFIVAWLTMLAALACNLIYEQSGLFRCILDASGSPELQDVILVLKQGDTSSQICVIIAAVVMAPIVEECCFRGLLYNVLRKYSGRIIATVGSSCMFGAVHMSLGQMLPLTIFALLQCVAYEKTKTLRTCIIAHALYNSCSIAVVYLLPDIT